MIVTSRCILVKLAPADAEKYYLLYTNPEVVKYITGVVLTPEEAKERFDKVVAIHAGNDDLGRFLISDKATAAFIGVAKLVITEKDELEMGLVLMPEYWAKGIATEVTYKLIEHSGRNFAAKRITALVDADNSGSVKVLEKVGLQCVETYTEKGKQVRKYRL